MGDHHGEKAGSLLNQTSLQNRRSLPSPPPHIPWSRKTRTEPSGATPGLPEWSGGSGHCVQILRLPESLKASHEDKHCPQNGTQAA